MDTKGKETAAAVGLGWRHKRRRRYTPEERLAMVRECAAPGASVAEVAQRNGVNTNLLFKWKRAHEGRLLPAPPTSTLVPVEVVKARHRRTQPAARAGAKPAVGVGAIEIELSGARIYLHGTVCEASLAAVLRTFARK